MFKVKLFQQSSPAILEKEINKWLDKNEIESVITTQYFETPANWVFSLCYKVKEGSNA